MNTRGGISAWREAGDYHHGPALLGFDKDDGELVQGENYHDVVAVLYIVERGVLESKNRLGTRTHSIGHQPGPGASQALRDVAAG